MIPRSDVFLLDGIDPQDGAMLQALYSRSDTSAREHYKKVQAAGSGKFMSKFYVGYGHPSIGDCGTVTLFFENVSMLAAKAIEDWSLFSGQESSTRYLDMSNRDIVDPWNKADILDRWMQFYKDAQVPVEAHVRALHPRQETEDEATYGRAIKARVFDILRAWLPAGCTTNLSWHTNFRQAADAIKWGQHHPLLEIRLLFSRALAALQEKYPESFSHVDKPEVLEWYEAHAETRYYAEDDESKPYFTENEHQEALWGYMRGAIKWADNEAALKEHYELLLTRPRGALVPPFLADALRLNWLFTLDFGSFRDLQRHRRDLARMPILTTEFGFHPWYLEQLPDDLRKRGRALIEDLTIELEKIPALPRQYYVPMGFMVRSRASYPLPALIHLLELRSGPTVHPTLRMEVADIIRLFRKEYPNIALYTNDAADDWTLRRGSQTILEK
jgi:thymidylate synthase ThyX